MSAPMTADQLLKQLKKWEVPYHEVDGWRTRGRDSATGLKFGPVYGFGIHHTGDDAPDHADQNVIINGRSDLPGPLAQFGGNDTGVIDLISIHRCNHFGGGDPRVLKAVQDESYSKYPPATTKHEGEAGAVDGNDAFYGIECYYSGGHPMTPALYKSVILLGAAICDFHGWSARSVIGHKEWSDYKVDPGAVDMYQFRLDIAEALRLGPPSQRGTTDTRITKADSALADAIRLISNAADARKDTKLADVAGKLKIQRARLPER